MTMDKLEWMGEGDYGFCLFLSRNASVCYLVTVRMSDYQLFIIVKLKQLKGELWYFSIPFLPPLVSCSSTP